MSKSVRLTTVDPAVSESPPEWVTVAALRSRSALPPVIGKLAVVPESVAGPMMPGATPRLVSALQRVRVERQRGRALREQLGLGRLRLDDHLAERQAASNALTPNTVLSVVAAVAVELGGQAAHVRAEARARHLRPADEVEDLHAALADLRRQRDPPTDPDDVVLERHARAAGREPEAAAMPDPARRAARVDRAAGDRERHVPALRLPCRSARPSRRATSSASAVPLFEREPGLAAGQVDRGLRRRRHGQQRAHHDEGDESLHEDLLLRTLLRPLRGTAARRLEVGATAHPAARTSRA